MPTGSISAVARTTACSTVAVLAVLLQVSLSFSADDRIDYLTQIKPVLRERCFACHGALKQEGGLRLDTVALAIKGGDSGAAIKPGDAEASALLQRVSASDEGERMPPEGEPLKPKQIAVLRNWIAQKANAPEDEKPDRDPREHWAFKTPVRPVVPYIDQPTPEQARWQRNPIDAFIASEHRKHSLVPQTNAKKRIWLRRVSLDLIGLPPTLATEFGRTPASQGTDGRDHHPYGFSVWMAGGGIQGGLAHGATDEIGFHAEEHRHYVTDIHATILKQLGLDSRKLEIPGRKRLEIDHGKPIDEIIA